MLGCFPWQKVHWGSIVSAYRRSPFFDYYSDDLSPFYHQRKWKFLIDFNREIQEVVFRLLNHRNNVQISDHYISPNIVSPEFDDFRYTIHPKVQRQATDKEFHPQQYQQVFQEKFGFIPNLSIVDLLFNEGPTVGKYLKYTAF
jgi:hypothetical protein